MIKVLNIFRRIRMFRFKNRF